MLILILKKLIPFKLRRSIRNIESFFRTKLHNFIYQFWIVRYSSSLIPALTKRPSFYLTNEDFVAFIDSHTIISKEAPAVIQSFLEKHPDTDLIYCDSDELTWLGFRCNPYFKSEWDPYLFASQNYFAPFYIVRKSILDEKGNLTINLDSLKIRHIPKILCHSKKPFKIQTTKAPIFPLPTPLPLVSILIPTKDGLSLLKPCIDSIFAKTSSRNFEIIIINNNSEKAETLEYFKEIQNKYVRVIDYPYPFNYSAINNFAAKAAKGEILLLLNNDIEVISENWLDEMLSLTLQKDIGIVGAKLYYPNDTIQHAGVVLGIDGTCRHILAGQKRSASGYFGNLKNRHCYAAITAACLMISKALYEKVGGLDENLFPVTCNDTDLCLKVNELGYRIVWTPFAEFYHKESATRGEDISPEKRARVMKETKNFLDKWSVIVESDPCYNPNLSLKSIDYSLAFPPRFKNDV